MDIEVVELGNNLRTMEISETQASERETQYTTKLHEMSQRYQEVGAVCSAVQQKICKAFKMKKHFVYVVYKSTCVILQNAQK